MEIKIEKLPESEIEIFFNIPYEDFKKFEEKAFLEIKNDFEIDGFRKGKAPDQVIIDKIGKEKIMAEGANIAIQESFTKAVLENKLEIISKPEATVIKLADGNNFEFKVKVSLMPKVEIKDYKKPLKDIKREKVDVKDSEIEEALKWTQKSRAKFIDKETPAENGDFIEIDYFTKETGEEKFNDAFILGEGRFLGGFEKDLIGLKSGDEKKDIEAKTKEGKETKADVKVVSVKKLEVPELDDDFAKSLGKFNSIKELKESIGEGLKKEKENLEKQKIRDKAIEKISESFSFELPKSLKERELDFMREEFENKVKNSTGMSLDQYLEKIKKTKEEIEDSLDKEAERKIRTILILKEISKIEDINASEEEVDAEVEKVLTHYKNKEEIGISEKELRERIKESLVYEKTFKLIENCIQ